MKRFVSLALAVIALQMLSSAQETRFDSSPVSEFDLSLYLGKWYEIARFDHSFERGMDNVTAEYVLRDDGLIDYDRNCFRILEQ